MGRRIYCIKCDKDLPSNRRVYCSNYCQIGYYNQKSKPIHKIDKWGRKYLACQHCKRRLKKIDHLGKIKFQCFKCYRNKHHESFQDSSFMKRIFKKNRQTKEIILEITKRNRNWHYVDGHPVLGFKNALKYFRVKCHTLIHREKFIEIKR